MDYAFEKFTNPNVRGLEQSATLLINEKVRNMRDRGKKVFNLGLGQSPFPVPDHIVNTLKLHAHEKNYLAVKGLESLRESVAEFHRSHDQVETSADQIMIGPGSKELLFLLQLCFDGEIFVPSPCWVSYIPQARILGKKISLVHTRFEDKWRIIPQKLQEVCEQRVDKDIPSLFILNYPGNPDGATYSVQELKDIAEIARENNLIVLSDEIYSLLHHQGEHVSIGRFYPEGTIISSGLSKWCGAGGWRLGTFMFPRGLQWLQEAMAVVASETYTSVNAPAQYAATEAFKGGQEIQEYLWHCRRILADTGQKTYDVLHTAGIKVHPPEGAFYHFADFSPFRDALEQRGITTSQELCLRLLKEAKVAALPGSAFARKKEDLTVRMAYVDFDGARALAQSKRIPLYDKLPESFSEKYCPGPLKAMHAIGKWLSKLQ